MAIKLNKLSSRFVSTVTKPGRHSDGGNLYLVVDKSGAKRWVFFYRHDNRMREMGLGGLTSVGLADARERAAEARALSSKRIDPLFARKSEVKNVPTFGEIADDFLAAMRPQFRNAKHAAQWEMTLRVYAKPLRAIRVDEVTTVDVLKVLKPIWHTKSETASRLRGRVERVLDAAKARGLRSGENPALWRGHLANLLPKRKKLARGHHAAMPYVDVPAFIASLRKRDAVAARALEFTILTAARSGETFGATWAEIDLEKNVWTVPADRMKGYREHRVPLVPRVVALLTEMAVFGTEGDRPIFPGRKSRKAPGAVKPLSTMAMDMQLRRMKVDFTVHGFRSSFRDWCGEESTFPREIAEAALAHIVGDETERAYRRSDALEKRRKLMTAWSNYCEPKPTNVLQLRKA